MDRYSDGPSCCFLKTGLPNPGTRDQAISTMKYTSSGSHSKTFIARNPPIMITPIKPRLLLSLVLTVMALPATSFAASCICLTCAVHPSLRHKLQWR